MAMASRQGEAVSSGGSLWVLAVVLAGACRGGTGAPPAANAGQVSGATPAPLTQPRPTTEEGCRACNGLGAVHGLATTPACNCRTRDAGKQCRDGSECEGMCVAAEQPERVVVSAGPPPQGYYMGRCSSLVTVFGCNRLIDRGA